MEMRLSLACGHAHVRVDFAASVAVAATLVGRAGSGCGLAVTSAEIVPAVAGALDGPDAEGVLRAVGERPDHVLGGVGLAAGHGRPGAAPVAGGLALVLVAGDAGVARVVPGEGYELVPGGGREVGGHGREGVRGSFGGRGSVAREALRPHLERCSGRRWSAPVTSTEVPSRRRRCPSSRCSRYRRRSWACSGKRLPLTARPPVGLVQDRAALLVAARRGQAGGRRRDGGRGGLGGRRADASVVYRPQLEGVARAVFQAGHGVGGG